MFRACYSCPAVDAGSGNSGRATRGSIRPGIGSFVFFVVAPGTVAGVVPHLLSRWRVRPGFLDGEGFRWIGAVVVLGSVAILIDCFARFTVKGRGTPSPILPTERLVVWGWYRFVRNPMYVAVVACILGQAVFFGNTDLLIYSGAVGLAFHSFVVLYEEPALRRRYGAEYRAYCAAVARWRPRLRPWVRVPQGE